MGYHLDAVVTIIRDGRSDTEYNDLLRFSGDHANFSDGQLVRRHTYIVRDDDGTVIGLDSPERKILSL